MKTKLAMVDMDGTLFCTNQSNYLSYKEALNKFGYDISYEYFVKNCMGRSFKDFLPKIVNSFDSNLIKVIHDYKKNNYCNYFRDIKVNTKLIELLKTIKKEYYIVLVTTASKKSVNELISFFNLNYLFDDYVTGDDVIVSKPNPECCLLAMKKFNIQPQDCIMFEDSEIGLQTTKNANVSCFIVNEFKE